MIEYNIIIGLQGDVLLSCRLRVRILDLVRFRNINEVIIIGILLDL
jgi:hypothetical protein